MSVPTPPTSRKTGGSVAKAGVNLLKRLVLDNYDEPMSNRRGQERQSVVGEVEVTLIGASGQPEVTTRAFVRDTTRSGCGLWSRIAMPVGRTVMIQGEGVGSEGKVQRMAAVCHCRGASGTGFAVGVRFLSESDAKAA